MFNRNITKEIFGYDIDPNKKSRLSSKQFHDTGNKLKKFISRR